ncbi:MAG: sigma-70 family RNA polymerase sigma factor [Myxococcales bacterium]|nr:sigma-70 family RNA polymerase sigma factor [Myxococcales bacterium]
MTSERAPSRAAIEAAWRVEAPRLLGALVRFVGDVDRAEDLAQDALALALERWPTHGIPDKPGAWLLATAKNRAIDEARRAAMARAKQPAIEHHLAQTTRAHTIEAREEEPVEDDVLRLILIACHPVLSREARVALTLRLVAGLSTAEIARAYLTTEATVAQRIVRAKRTLAEARVPFELPRGDELLARVHTALEVVYLIFNEGYAATAGDRVLRSELCDEAMRLGRVLAASFAHDSEVHGALALMELQASRSRARVGSNGAVILLLDQDRARWDQHLIHRGLAGLERAASLRRPLGPYAIQAAIAACHARARRAEDTDWAQIVALYDALVELTGSPVVELNRAVAVCMAYGARDALALVDELADDLADYHPYFATRGDILEKLGRAHEAKLCFEEAARRTQNARERELLLTRAARNATDA